MYNNDKVMALLTEEELQQVSSYAVTCARLSLPIFEAQNPLDQRPKEAIAEAEAFAAGKRRTASLRATAWSALAVARELGDIPAAHAAYAASHAAASAYLHPIASSHQIKHILGSAIHMIIAFELDALYDAEVGNERIRWAVSMANSTVWDVLRRYPPPRKGRGRFSELFCYLDTQLRKPEDR